MVGDASRPSIGSDNPRPETGPKGVSAGAANGCVPGGAPSTPSIGPDNPAGDQAGGTRCRK
eukprot:433102-Karenia_brevis.AAC.1